MNFRQLLRFGRPRREGWLERQGRLHDERCAELEREYERTGSGEALVEWKKAADERKTFWYIRSAGKRTTRKKWW